MRGIFKRSEETGKITGLQNPKGIQTLVFLLAGLGSLIWFLIRVIPKPTRAQYPCMKVTMPIAYSFIAYLVALSGSLLFFKKAYSKFRKKEFSVAFLLLFLVIGTGVWALVNNETQAKANSGNFQAFNDPLGANSPIGEAKGIFPGRVVWAWNPDATNENCTNSNHSNAYWLDSNTNQEAVDQMLSESLRQLTGEESDSAAWSGIFKYFNQKHGKGVVGYDASETIFIKINAVTAWSGAEPDGEMPAGLGIEFDTSPQTILAMLRQLVNVVGVPEEKIYIGDPMCDIYNTLYLKFYEEFPNINYVSQSTVTARYKLTKNTTADVVYSDKGSVLTEITSHSLFKEMTDADYLINIPTLKGHRWAGVTFFAKNHFGSNTTDHSWELHKGLMNPDNNGMRYGYYKYRVLVDLMGSKYLGGNTLLFFMDGLWATSYEHQKPQKFQTKPYFNDWCSSMLLSLDPVAIESVCLDILQAEFTEEDLTTNPPRHTYVQWDGIDDYLHQAASSEWWPEGIEYDPDNSGTPIPSLGVHEHWNNTEDMQYSGNLETGEGIELVKLWAEVSEPQGIDQIIVNRSIHIFPNPVIDNATLSFVLESDARLNICIYSMEGQMVEQYQSQALYAGYNELFLNLNALDKGNYQCVVEAEGGTKTTRFSQRLVKL